MPCTRLHVKDSRKELASRCCCRARHLKNTAWQTVPFAFGVAVNFVPVDTHRSDMFASRIHTTVSPAGAMRPLLHTHV